VAPPSAPPTLTGHQDGPDRTRKDLSCQEYSHLPCALHPLPRAAGIIWIVTLRCRRAHTASKQASKQATSIQLPRGVHCVWQDMLSLVCCGFIKQELLFHPCCVGLPAGPSQAFPARPVIPAAWPVPVASPGRRAVWQPCRRGSTQQLHGADAGAVMESCCCQLLPAA